MDIKYLRQDDVNAVIINFELFSGETVAVILNCHPKM